MLTLMPDHCHFLVELGVNLSLSKAVSRLKAKAAPGLKCTGATWERGFFDHRLRPDDRIAAILRYIVMNPVQSDLVDKADAASWPWLRLSQEESRWFMFNPEQGNSESKASQTVPDWLQ